MMAWPDEPSRTTEVASGSAKPIRGQDASPEAPTPPNTTLGDASWPILAEDHDYADDVELAAFEDLTRVLLTITAEQPERRSCDRTFVVQGQMVRSQTALHVPGLAQLSDAWVPRPIRDLFGCLVSVRGQEYLVLARGLMNSYDDSLSMFRAFPGSLDKIEGFVTSYNSGTPGDGSIIVAALDGSEHPPEDLRAFQARVLKGYGRVEMPSLLTARIESGQLCLAAPAWRGRPSDMQRADLVLCFRQGEWRIGF